MTEKPRFRAIKGVRDILPPETSLWNRVEQTARDVFGNYGYGEIRPPIFEQTELFARSIGGETDVVSKEMYTFEDRGTGELSALKDEIAIRAVSQEQEGTLRDFTGAVEKFVSLLNAGIRSGEVPASRFNEMRIASLNNAPNRLNRLSQLPHTTQGRDIFDSVVDAVKFHAFAVLIGDRVTLRPEATASVCRAYIEHGMHTWPQPVKLYYMGEMFRRERPQKGRYRQFYQIGAEILGSNIPHFAIDAEVIAMLMVFFDRCGLTGHELYINSIGDQNCRPQYVALLREQLHRMQGDLSPDSRRRIETNPLRVFDSKALEDQTVIAGLPKIADHLCKECRDHYEGLKTVLEMRGVKFHVNPLLVRGLDYYVRATFEVTAPGLGSQNAICGGGRYDGLVELIGGEKFKGVGGIGFAIGEDRLIEALQYLGVRTPSNVDIVIAWKDENSRNHAATIAQLLRDSGLSVEVPVKPISPGDGLRLANRIGAPIGIVIGPDEVSAGTFGMRMLAEAGQVSLKQSQIQDKDLRLLLQFRVLLERELQQIAIISGIEYKNTAPVRLAEKLIGAGALSGDLKFLISVAMDTFNNLLHGQKVEEAHLSEAIAASVRVLDELSSAGSKSRFRLG
jgi:histidyl-tRNA synthetase